MNAFMTSNNAEADTAMRKEMICAFDVRENPAKHARIEETLDVARSARDKPPNKVMRMTGVERTVAMRGLTSFVGDVQSARVSPRSKKC